MRWYTATRRWHDAVWAALFVLIDLLLFSTLLSGQERPDDWPAWAIIGYAAVAGALLAARRRAPLLVFAGVWAHAVLAMFAHGYRPTIGLLLALYTVAVHCGLRTALALLLAVAVPNGLVVAFEAGQAPPAERTETALGVGLFLALIDVAVWSVGRAVRAGRERTAALERRRELAAREAVTAERARIARELHDIVAHTVTLMSLHAAGAKGVLRHDPDRAEQALGDVNGLGVRAMAELRRMLTVLRDPGDPPSADRPGLADLEPLLSGVRAAGVHITLSADGVPGHLDPSVAATAYRVVREAVLNVAKHSGPGTSAEVRLDWTERELSVEVTDDGAGTPPSPRLSTGHGLLGLRERVSVAGGTLDAGRQPEGGYRVAARLPVATAYVEG